MDTLSCIKKRRSIRNFKEKEISEKVLLGIIEAGRWAPSPANMQNTRFVVVEDASVKEQIASATHQKDAILNSSAVIIVCSLTEAVRKAFPKGGEFYATQSTAAAIQNILLAATSKGIGSLWIGAFSDFDVRKATQIANDVEIHALIALGYSAEKPSIPGRIKLCDLTYFEKWFSLDKTKFNIFPLSESSEAILKKAEKIPKRSLRGFLKRKPAVQVPEPPEPVHISILSKADIIKEAKRGIIFRPSFLHMHEFSPSEIRNLRKIALDFNKYK